LLRKGKTEAVNGKRGTHFIVTKVRTAEGTLAFQEELRGRNDSPVDFGNGKKKRRRHWFKQAMKIKGRAIGTHGRTAQASRMVGFQKGKKGTYDRESQINWGGKKETFPTGTLNTERGRRILKEWA